MHERSGIEVIHMPVSWDDIRRHHKVFEAKVMKTIREKYDCMADSMTYHEKLSKEMQEALKKNNEDINALRVRSSADFLVIHLKSFKTLELEIKTCIEDGRKNLALEALPLAFHGYNARLGINCLYAFWDPFREFERGFWINESMPKISRVLFPKSTSIVTKGKIMDAFWYAFSDTDWYDEISFEPLSYTPKTGSPDPFVLIPYSELESVPHWEKQVEEYLAI